MNNEQLTEEQAIAFGENNLWEELSLEERAKFQMSQEKLCMPFDKFHEAIEKTLGRSVFTHEFGLNPDGIKKELFEGGEPPSLKDIIEMIPEEKRAILVLE